jgi:hypothetical protein
MKPHVKIRLFCTCGAYRRGHLPDYIAALVLKDWATQHTGEGHAPCTPKEAARARANAEKERIIE